MNDIDIRELIDSYKEIGTSTIGHLTGKGYLPDIKPLNPCTNTIVGRVLTVQLISDNTDVINQALIQATPNDVLCIDAQVLGIKACWGALRTCAAIYEKLSAVIVIGQATDSVQIQQLGFSVFAQGISAVTTFKSDHIQGTLASDIAYRFGEQTTTIRSGDIAMMDNDGVFILSVDVAQKLLPDCQKKHKADEIKFQMFFEAYTHNALDEMFNSSSNTR
ncbi:RraA family protein [Psychrobacter sp. NG254]|uniref:RraA family protein n=1 Tax=Psychrobacter sp. NG254 TaxID=2782003 RepID=UPI001888BC46|nr:RraA family protein [Psychrobacter sp. NG254]MBF2719967.1 RraA family protein [Psychrobacter sp. NG254]